MAEGCGGLSEVPFQFWITMSMGEAFSVLTNAWDHGHITNSTRR
jgi:hypothetical protein